MKENRSKIVGMIGEELAGMFLVKQGFKIVGTCY